MIRRVVTALLLVAFVLTIWVWVYSYLGPFKYAGYSDFFWRPYTFRLADGCMYLRENTMVEGPSNRFVTGPSRLPRIMAWRTGLPLYILPLWTPALVFGLLLFFVGFAPAHRRRKRRKRGLCVKCGYDLRGSYDRCPECNTAIKMQ